MRMGGDKQKLDRLFTLYHSVLPVIGEISGQGQTLKEIFLKIVTVSVASYFEAEAKQTIRVLSESLAGKQGRLLVNFIEKGILERGYHNLFVWDNKKGSLNANRFYAFFNDESSQFAIYMKGKEKEDKSFAEAARCFVELGKARNDLVHNDLASLSFSLSMEEVEAKYHTAQKFLPDFLQYALEFAHKNAGEESPPAP